MQNEIYFSISNFNFGALLWQHLFSDGRETTTKIYFMVSLIFYQNSQPNFFATTSYEKRFSQDFNINRQQIELRGLYLLTFSKQNRINFEEKMFNVYSVQLFSLSEHGRNKLK